MTKIDCDYCGGSGVVALEQPEVLPHTGWRLTHEPCPQCSQKEPRPVTDSTKIDWTHEHLLEELEYAETLSQWLRIIEELLEKYGAKTRFRIDSGHNNWNAELES